MRVSRLTLTSFRSFSKVQLEPGPGINILFGANAQGKTTVLEAISILATTRSLRASRESQVIRHGEESAEITAEIEREREGEAELNVAYFEGDRKAVRFNTVKRPRVLDLLGEFNAVYFGPQDLAIVQGEPSERRRYLNVEISQISPRYVYDLAQYKRSLAQRNRLLRDFRERGKTVQESGLEAWNEQLISYGSRIVEKRRFFLDRLSPIADEIHLELTEGRERLETRYAPSISLPENGACESPAPERNHGKAAEQVVTGSGPQDRIAAQFRKRLLQVSADEIRRGATLLGPQRDDLFFYISGRDAGIFGSQGQQRTVALALKLAEFRLIEEYVGEPPVMLLDDVMSDLDDSRRAHLLRWLKPETQAFLTCTSLRAFPAEVLKRAAVFKVEDGSIRPQSTDG
ncbi:MAG TPA: DNA replication/repair protein RecF [Chthonomonadales bacterium]|nr:DNA replication/repair protein RecF [Chthonomonadales bacterium]